MKKHNQREEVIKKQFWVYSKKNAFTPTPSGSIQPVMLGRTSILSNHGMSKL